MADSRAELIDLICKRGLIKRTEPFRLSSGELSYDYIDGKLVVADGEGMKLAANAILALADAHDAHFNVVGGLTMGADALAHGIALVGNCGWFTVRKQRKEHGKQRQIEGTELGSSSRVLLVDDVVSTGGSILEALDAVQATGASVVLAVTLVDRGDHAAGRFRERGIAYEPVATYSELGIEPVGGSTPDA